VAGILKKDTSKVGTARKADKLSAMSRQSKKMWDPGHLATTYASSACTVIALLLLYLFLTNLGQFNCCSASFLCVSEIHSPQWSCIAMPLVMLETIFFSFFFCRWLYSVQVRVSLAWCPLQVAKTSNVLFCFMTSASFRHHLHVFLVAAKKWLRRVNGVCVA
jgi:hypothetical protein